MNDPWGWPKKQLEKKTPQGRTQTQGLQGRAAKENEMLAPAFSSFSCISLAASTFFLGGRALSMREAFSSDTAVYTVINFFRQQLDR